MKYIALLGRVLFSLIFIFKSIGHFSKSGIEMGANAHLFMPGFLVPIAGILALLGGLSILLGYKARVGAWLLIIFLVPVTLTMHRFWMVQDFNLAMLHEYCFMKNLSMIGAALLIAYFGSGPLSLSKD